MRSVRMTQATVNALTTFNQRRLLEAQVETSFLLQPWNTGKGSDKGRSERERRRKRMEESSSDESEEDFAFLDNELKDKQELDEIS